MIAIIDYGMGNLTSVHNAFRKIGLESVITSDRQVVLSASHVVLPGVGAFQECLNQLNRRELVPAIRQVIRSGKPFLGICLGYQLLFSRSEEFGEHEGLDILPGRVRRFPETGLKVPHIGWNQVEAGTDCPIYRNIPLQCYFYFDHSYFVDPEKESLVSSWTDYGIRFASSVWKDNLFACQFHPEKSQRWGLALLENFGKLK